jgi:hypothetical protein
MNMKQGCCSQHPPSCLWNGGINLVALLFVGFGFGWRWLVLYLALQSSVDWLIRVWKHPRIPCPAGGGEE